jgi:hypothetical protein
VSEPGILKGADDLVCGKPQHEPPLRHDHSSAALTSNLRAKTDSHDFVGLGDRSRRACANPLDRLQILRVFDRSCTQVKSHRDLHTRTAAERARRAALGACG